MSQKKRLSLVERQQKLLEAEGFSKPSPPPLSSSSFSSSSSSSSYSSLPADFRERQDAHLLRTGRTNATSASRVVVDFSIEGDDENGIDAVDDNDCSKSIKSAAHSTSSRYSHAPSIHPSLSGLSEASSACSTIRYALSEIILYLLSLNLINQLIYRLLKLLPFFIL